MPPGVRPPGRRGRRGIVVLVAVCAALAVVTGVLVVLRDGGDGASVGRVRPGDVLTERQLGLVRAAVPDPGCGNESAPRPADRSLVPLDVMRVDGTCLSVVTEYMPASEVEARRRALAADPAVVVAAVAPPMSADAVDDRRGKQWPLDLLGVPEESADLPWPDGTGVVVAVIDTGVDAAHPDLAGAVVGRRHYPGEAALDPGGHGTHVAGIIAARRDNGGTIGMAPGASVLDVPVHLKDDNEDGPEWWTGLTWAVNHGADVANMSFGGAYSLYQKSDYRDALVLGAAAVEFARDSDVLLVTSAGNCGKPSAGVPVIGGCEDRHQRKVPAVFEGVVSVGAVRKDVALAAYSSRNGDVDLVAPGGQTKALTPPWAEDEDTVLSTAPDGGYAWIEGTSQAAPHVAAAAAVGRFVRPEATADEIARALLETADRDRVAEDDRDSPGAGRGLLDVRAMVDRLRTGAVSPTGPSGSPTGGPRGGATGRTQAAYMQDGTLYAYDGTTSHPVRAADRPPRWLAWSADGKLLVGADDRTLFSWAGPGTKAVEKPCDGCADSSGSPAFVEDVAVTDPGGGAPTGDLVLRMDVDGTLTRINAHTLDEIGSSLPAYPADSIGSKSLSGAVGGKLLVHESGGAHTLERLWLVDPVSGEVGPSQRVAGSVLGTIAVSASGDRVAVATGWATCGTPEGVYVFRGGDLGEAANPATPPGVMFDELFFNGGTLYAAMSGYEMSPGKPCARTASVGLWRLVGSAWERVDPAPTAGRPLEGRPGGPTTGWIVVRDGRAVLEPTAPGDPDKGDLGPVGDRVWSTPTRTEVPLKPPR